MQPVTRRVVAQLLDVYADDDQIHMVLDYCPTSLEDIISDQTLSIRLQDVKSYMHMALTGLAYVHSQWITHRVRQFCAGARAVHGMLTRALRSTGS